MMIVSVGGSFTGYTVSLGTMFYPIAFFAGAVVAGITWVATKRFAAAIQNVPVPLTQEHQTTPWLIIGSVGRIVGAVIMVLILFSGLSIAIRQGREHYDDPMQDPRGAPTSFVGAVISDFSQGITPNNQRGYVEQYRVPLSKVNRNKYKNVLLLHEAVSATNTDMSIGKSLAYENAFREEYERRLRPLISASVAECRKAGNYSSAFDGW